jgi:TetR/AcrR family fatty acid metabolism transcriptional regulator
MEATPREIKRELIINAAIQVITEKGYHNTTMGEIAAVAGIGKATIYEYFNSKTGVIPGHDGKHHDAYNTTISWDRSFDRPVAERLKTLIESHIKFCREIEINTHTVLGIRK